MSEGEGYDSADRNRSLFDVPPMRRRDPSRVVRWNAEDDERLTRLVQGSESVYWKEVAAHFPGRTEAQCYVRWNRVLFWRLGGG